MGQGNMPVFTVDDVLLRCPTRSRLALAHQEEHMSQVPLTTAPLQPHLCVWEYTYTVGSTVDVRNIHH